MNWLNRTLTGKFTLLLAGFLALQALQLGVGIYGILHIGEEGVHINEAGRQRMRTYQFLYLAHEALENHSWPSEGRKIVDDVLADYDATSDGFDTLAASTAGDEKFREAVAHARTHWDGELKLLLLAFDPSDLQTAAITLAKFEALVPGHIRHLDEVVKLLEQDAIEDAHDLAIFQAVILGLTLLLGVTGFAMARYVVTRPLRHLIEATSAIAAGAYEKRVAIASRDEIGELANTFNRMAAAVSDKTTRVAALNDIAVKITSVRSLQEMLDEIMRYGAALAGAQAACIAFYNQETGLFDKWVTQGLSDHFVKNMAFRKGGLADEAYVMTVGTYILSNDQPETKHKLSRLTDVEGIQSFLCLPLVSHAERPGVIYFYRKDRDYFLPDEIEILITFASLAAGAILNIRLQEQTRELAVTDKLTGLHNRRLFDDRLQEEIQRATRYAKPLSLLMIDIDHFKLINDTHGHAGGDLVLQSLGRLLPRLLREVDLPARYGGEEFTVILPETDFVGARLVGERVRRAIAGERVTLPEGGEITFTASVGVACFPVCGDKAGSLIEHADQALYTAKQEGRNRVCLYREILKAQLENDPERIADLLNQSLDNIQPIVTAVSAKSVYYHDHAEKVNTIAKQLGEALNLGEEDLRTLALAAQLHDIGMISVPDAVLNKQGALTDDDWKLIRQHPDTAADLLEKVPGLRQTSPIVRHHHTRFDGKGYPEGLKGDAIPYLARVLAVADTYASMTGKWMGSEVMSPTEARTRLAAAAGGQLDPQIVAAFMQALDR